MKCNACTVESPNFGLSTVLYMPINCYAITHPFSLSPIIIIMNEDSCKPKPLYLKFSSFVSLLQSKGSLLLIPFSLDSQPFIKTAYSLKVLPFNTVMKQAWTLWYLLDPCLWNWTTSLQWQSRQRTVQSGRRGQFAVWTIHQEAAFPEVNIIQQSCKLLLTILLLDFLWVHLCTWSPKLWTAGRLTVTILRLRPPRR